MIKNHRAILRSDIRSLPVQGRGIMVRPENVEKLIVIDLRRIEFDVHHLSVSGFIGADISIGWILLCPACVSGRGGQHALQIAKSFFNPPEAACAECGFLGLHTKMMLRLLAARNHALCTAINESFRSLHKFFVLALVLVLEINFATKSPTRKRAIWLRCGGSGQW